MVKRVRGVRVQVFVAVALFMSCHNASASDSTIIRLKKNIAFLTFGGKDNFGSVNYERIFSMRSKLNWSFSIGVQPFQLSRKFSLPVSVNAFTKGRLHHLEVDLTATFFMDKLHPYNGGLQDDFNKQIYLTPFVSYRLQGSRRVMFKTGIGPQLLIDPPSNNIAAIKTSKLQFSAFGSLGVGF